MSEFTVSVPPEGSVVIATPATRPEKPLSYKARFAVVGTAVVSLLAPNIQPVDEYIDKVPVGHVLPPSAKEWDDAATPSVQSIAETTALFATENPRITYMDDRLNNDTSMSLVSLGGGMVVPNSRISVSTTMSSKHTRRQPTHINFTCMTMPIPSKY